MHIVVLFNLKPGVTVADYEAWARTSDIPGVRAIPSVTAYDVHRVTGLFGSDDKPPYQYIEHIQLNGMDGFVADIQAPAVQTVVAQFGEMADNPIFLLAEDL